MSNKHFSTRRSRMNHQLLANAETIVSEWLEGEIQGEEFVAINPLRDDASLGSFKINLSTGVWKDFADEDFGGPDLVSLYRQLNGLDEADALKSLEDLFKTLPKKGSAGPIAKRMKGKKSAVQSVPAPSDCHLPPDMHPDLGAPSMTWEYKTAGGETAFLVYRFDTDKGKETRPVSYNPEKQDWQWKLPALPLALYNLDQITTETDKAIIVVEGEKAADAATSRFPDHISTTSASGSDNALKSDWRLLKGREVTLIPDADVPGTKYAKTVGAELLAIGCEVFVIDTLTLGWTDGDDVADYSDLNQDWLIDNRKPVREWPEFPGMDNLLVEAAARLSPLDYDRRKEDLVDILGGVNKRTLDSLVKAARRANAESENTEPDRDGLFTGEEPWPEPVDGKALVTEIQSVIRSHVILSAHEALTVAFWVILSYVFRAFRVCPRLLVSSPEKRCGKTTLLETLQALCFRGLAAANISAASLFRGLEAWSPSLLIDEADTFLQGNDELRGILNSGHTKSTAYVIRTVGDEHEPKLFPTFAPIAIGMIKRPPDTLLDRSLVIRLHRKLGTDPVTALPLEAEQEYLPIRQKCLRWAEDNFDQLQGDKELTPADINNDRARDNWIPLTAIASQCGFLADAQTACRQLTLKDDDSLTVELLADIQQIFREENKEKLPSKVLVKKLISMEERPWEEYQRGKPLTQNRLAQLLKDFDVHTRQAKVGAKNLKHYFRVDLEPLFERYLKKESTLAPSEITATPLPKSENPDAARAAAVSDSVAVAPVTPGNGDDSAQTAAGLKGQVAVDETLPLPATLSPGLTDQGLQSGSEVAAQNKDQQFSDSCAANQGGE